MFFNFHEIKKKYRRKAKTGVIFSILNLQSDSIMNITGVSLILFISQYYSFISQYVSMLNKIIS